MLEYSEMHADPGWAGPASGQHGGYRPSEVRVPGRSDPAGQRALVRGPGPPRVGHLTVQKVVDEGEHFVGLVLEHEVAGIEKVELEVIEVTLVGMCAGFGENEIILAPDDEPRGLLWPPRRCLYLQPALY
jgi:hypothetical protein